MSHFLLCLIIGVCSGIISGLVGIGGGLVLIPALLYFFGFSQGMAQGTSLAIFLPPIGFFAVMTYYKNGLVNTKIATFICLGFFIGALFGSKFAMKLSNEILQKIFGSFMVLMGLYILFKNKILK